MPSNQVTCQPRRIRPQKYIPSDEHVREGDTAEIFAGESVVGKIAAKCARGDRYHENELDINTIRSVELAGRYVGL